MLLENYVNKSFFQDSSNSATISPKEDIDLKDVIHFRNLISQNNEIHTCSSNTTGSVIDVIVEVIGDFFSPPNVNAPTHEYDFPGDRCFQNPDPDCQTTPYKYACDVNPDCWAQEETTSCTEFDNCDEVDEAFPRHIHGYACGRHNPLMNKIPAQALSKNHST